jgi:uncharacterized protein (UPF0332 family)
MANGMYKEEHRPVIRLFKAEFVKTGETYGLIFGVKSNL